MPSSLKDRIKLDKKSPGDYPVVDCPLCNKKDVPVAFLYFEIKPIPYCLGCHCVIEKLEPKGYVSLIDLEECEWNSEI